MSIRVVTGTGFSGEARRRFKDTVEELAPLGLTISGDLVLGVTDVLVCGQNAAPGNEKVVMAKLWQLPIVSLDWLTACHRAGEVVRTDNFLMQLGEEDSLPEAASDSLIPAHQSTAVPGLADGISDYRSSYPPICRLSTRSSFKDSANSMLEPIVSPRSPTAFLLEPLEKLRSKAFSKQSSQSQGALQLAAAEALHPGPSPQSTPEPEAPHEPCCHSPVATAARVAAPPPMPPSPQPSPELSSPQIDSLSKHEGRVALRPTTILNELHELTLDCPNQDAESVSVSASACTPQVSSASTDGPTGAATVTPPSVKVHASNQLARAPKRSTAAAFHGCPVKALTFYNDLEVKDSAQGTCFRFSMRDPHHCALVYYDDREDAHELAYCDLFSTYTTADGQVWVEHGYLHDAADMRQHPNGQHFLEKHSVADDELINGQSMYHSPAKVIEGDFWLYGSRMQAQRARQLCKDASQLFMFTSKTWDRRTGSLIVRPGRNLTRMI